MPVEFPSAIVAALFVFSYEGRAIGVDKSVDKILHLGCKHAKLYLRTGYKPSMKLYCKRQANRMSCTGTVHNSACSLAALPQKQLSLIGSLRKK